MAEQFMDTSVMTLREVLALPSFEGATIIAGADGLDHIVTNAMIMEAADIEKWGRPGLLVISSFYALQDLSQVQIEAFLTRFAGMDMAGIVFKPERFIMRVPAFVRTACDRLSIPIIQVTRDTKYEPILMDVMGNVINSNVTLLNRFFDVHREVSRLALEQPTLYDIVRKLSETTRHNVTYFDRANDVRFSTADGLESFDRYQLEELERGRYQTFRYYQATLFYPDGSEQSAVTVLVPGLERRVVHLMLHVSPARLTAIDCMSVENYASLLQSELLKQAAVAQRMFNTYNDIVHDLLLNRFSTKQDLTEALQRLGIGDKPQYQVLMVRVTIQDPAQSERQDDLMRALAERFKRGRHSIVYFQSGNRIVFLGNFGARSNGFAASGIKSILNAMHADSEFPAFTHLTALSALGSQDDISALNEQALGIYRLFDPNSSVNQDVSYEDLGVYKLLMTLSNLSDVDGYLDPRLMLLRRENPLFFETLETLVRCDFSSAETARQLFVHPKTIRYRIERIHDVYGIDIHDSNDLTQVLLGIKLEVLRRT